MLSKIGIGELILIMGLALVIFGPSKLPELGQSMGQAINEFKKASTDTMSGSKKDSSEDKKED